MNNRYLEAIRRFDAANAEDPRTDDVDGEAHPRELLYAMRMSERLEAFAPGASEALRLAARAQHIRRWDIPRSEYPMDRSGYRRWRTALGAYHADVAAEIMADVGYAESEVERVRDLLQKKRLKKDPEVQALEDVICLVFLEHYLEAFAREQEEEKMIKIIRKTWAKMSERGQAAALSLPLTPSVQGLIMKALDR